MLHINQRRYNLSYDPILDNYEQFANLPKITHNGSKVLFGQAMDQGNKKFLNEYEIIEDFSLQIMLETMYRCDICNFS